MIQELYQIAKLFFSAVLSCDTRAVNRFRRSPHLVLLTSLPMFMPLLHVFACVSGYIQKVIFQRVQDGFEMITFAKDPVRLNERLVFVFDAHRYMYVALHN